MFGFKNYLLATSFEEAYSTLLKNKKNIILGGCSFLKMSKIEFNIGIDISNLNLNYITEDENFIHIGSMTTFRELEINETIKKYNSGIISKAVSEVVGVQFRNNVTVGATVFSKYGFSDLITPLLACEATVVLHNKGEITLEEFLKIEKVERDILVEIKLQKNDKKGSFQAVRKSSTDYSILNVAVVGNNVAIGARPSRAILIKNYSEELIKEVEFGSNMRGSKEYREHLAKALVKKAMMEVE